MNKNICYNLNLEHINMRKLKKKTKKIAGVKLCTICLSETMEKTTIMV